MARQFTQIAFTPGVKAAQTRYGSRDVYQNMAKRGVTEDVLTSRETEFIKARDSFYLGTVSSNGWPYIQFRGGPQGFLKVLDQKNLGLADFNGNLQYISVGNLAENNRVFLFLMDYAQGRRLKIWGRAQVVDDDPELFNRLADPSYEAEIGRAFLIRVEALDWNCPQHIPMRYSEADVAAMVAPLQARIRELEELPEQY